MDDGGGAMISWTVLSLLHSLNIRAKRTIRCVLWSCEEFGGIGADQYFTAHENEVPSMSIVMESDMGVFHPRGLEFQGTNQAQQVGKNEFLKRFFQQILFLDYTNNIGTININ
jgi:carboxypeptidase Q